MTTLIPFNWLNAYSTPNTYIFPFTIWGQAVVVSSSSSSGLDIVLVDTVPIDIVSSVVTAVTQKELNATPQNIVSSAVAPVLQKELNAAPLDLIVSIVSPAIGSTVSVNADVVVINSSVVALSHQFEVNVGVVTVVGLIVIPILEHQINTDVLELVITIVTLTTSHDIAVSFPEIIHLPEAIVGKDSLFAAFNERIKLVSKQPIISEFVLEDTAFPYISLHQVYNVLSWKNSCLERFEEGNYRISVYAEAYGELTQKIEELKRHFTYNTLLLNSSKQLIQLDQLAVETTEIIPQLYRAQLLYQTIVQREIDQTYILSPTFGETLNKVIYNRFKQLPICRLVNDLVSPGYALENSNLPYLVVPEINERLEWNHSLGRIDNVRYPINVFSEDLNELTKLIDEIEKSYDYARFVIDDKEHLINEWVGTDIVEVQPQMWCGKVNYEVLVESTIMSYKE